MPSSTSTAGPAPAAAAARPTGPKSSHTHSASDPTAAARLGQLHEQQQKQQQQQQQPWTQRLSQIESILSEPAVLKAFCAFFQDVSSGADSKRAQDQASPLHDAAEAAINHQKRLLNHPQVAQLLQVLLRSPRQLGHSSSASPKTSSLSPTLTSAACQLECGLRLDLGLAMLWSAAKASLLAAEPGRPLSSALHPAGDARKRLQSPAPITSTAAGQGGVAPGTALADPNPLRGAIVPALRSLPSLMLTERDFIPLNNLQRSRAGIVEVVRCRLNRKLYVLKSMLKGVARREPHRTSPMTEKTLLCLASDAAHASAAAAATTAAASDDDLPGGPRPSFTPQICAAFQSTGSLHIVMEYFPAGDLNTFLESAGSASMAMGTGADKVASIPGRNPTGGLLLEAWVKSYAADIVAAVGWVHEQGFAHRDIKPSNFLMDHTGHLKLCDFSTAAPVSVFDVVDDAQPQDLQRERRVHRFHCREPAGTCDYIAPEILLYEEQRLAAEASWDESLQAGELSSASCSASVMTTVSTSMVSHSYSSVIRQSTTAAAAASSSIMAVEGRLSKVRSGTMRPGPATGETSLVGHKSSTGPAGEDAGLSLKKPFSDCSNTIRATQSAANGNVACQADGDEAGCGKAADPERQSESAPVAAEAASFASAEAESSQGPGGYGPEVDWWSVGVVIYEMTYGKLPFWARDPAEAFQRIMNHTKFLMLDETVQCSEELRHLIRSLISPRTSRLGRECTADVKKHPLFKGITWDRLHSMDPPFVPTVERADAAAAALGSAESSPEEAAAFEQEPSVLHSPSPSVWRSSPAAVPPVHRTSGSRKTFEVETSLSMLSIVSPVSFSAMYQGNIDDFPAFVNELDHDEELSALCAEHEASIRDLDHSLRRTPQPKSTTQAGTAPANSQSKNQAEQAGFLNAKPVLDKPTWDDVDLEWVGFTLQPKSLTCTPRPSAVPSKASALHQSGVRTGESKGEVRFAGTAEIVGTSETSALPAIQETEGSGSPVPAASTPFVRRMSSFSTIASLEPVPSPLATPYSRQPAANTMPRSLQRRAVEAAGWARVGIDSRFVTPMRKTSLPNFGMTSMQEEVQNDGRGGQRSVSAPKAGLPSPYPFPVTASRRTSSGEPAASVAKRQRSSSQSDARSRSNTPADPISSNVHSSGSDSRYSGGSITKRDYSEREAWDRMMKAVQKSAKKKRQAEDERIAMSGQMTIGLDGEWSISRNQISPDNIIASPPTMSGPNNRFRPGSAEQGLGAGHGFAGRKQGLPRWSSSRSVISEGERHQLANYDWRQQADVPARTSSRPSLVVDVVSPTSRQRAMELDYERPLNGYSTELSRVPSRQSIASTPPHSTIPQSISNSSISSTGSLSDLDGDAAQVRWPLRQRRSTRQLLIKAQERTTPSKAPRARGPSLTSAHGPPGSDAGGSMRIAKARPASVFGWSSVADVHAPGSEERGMLSAPPTAGMWGLGANQLHSMSSSSLASSRRRSMAEFPSASVGSIKQHRSVTNVRAADEGNVRRKSSQEILREYSQGLIGAPGASQSSSNRRPGTGSSSGTSGMPMSSSSRQGTDWARTMDDRHVALQRNIDEIEGRISKLRLRLRQEEEERRSALTELRRLAHLSGSSAGSGSQNSSSDRVDYAF